MNGIAMSILSSILAKIFPSSHPAVVAAAPPPATATATPAVAPAAAVLSEVDVEKILGEGAAGHAEKLNWRTSIVDLMKLLDLDSSLAARKTLAAELHYTGDTSDSATMNIWLQKQVMAKLAANGGKVPADLM